MSNLPWIEKYRPNELSDIISHKEIINTLTNLITFGTIPHMIFYGPPGTGKTTTILACARMIYGQNYRSMILELNGSDDRGINVVRDQIKNFSATDSRISSMLIGQEDNSNISENYGLVGVSNTNGTQGRVVNASEQRELMRASANERTQGEKGCTQPFSSYESEPCSRTQGRIQENIINTRMKLVILDEADAMTSDAQFALRQVVETYTDSTRFCLICNYYTKIIQALRSRCQVFRFVPIKKEEHITKINMIIRNEGINIEQKAKEKIVELSEGDMRKSINLLQSLHMSNKNEITMDIVYKTIGYPSDEDREQIINNPKGKTLQDTYLILNKIEQEKNLSNQDILRELIQHYEKVYIQEKKQKKINKEEQYKLIDFFIDLAKIEVNLASNSNSNIQLMAISSIINNFNS